MNIMQYLGRGYRHEVEETDCQDYADYYVPDKNSENQNIIMAVSDGCSSSKFAKEAAKSNVDAIIKYFKDHSLEEFLKNPYYEQQAIITKCCWDALANEAKNQNSDSVSDFSATLVFVVINKQQILIGHIGDGAVFCLDGKNSIINVSRPDNGSASYYTYFTSCNRPDFLHLTTLPRFGIKNIVLTTDGPGSLIERVGTYDILNPAVIELSKSVTTGEVTNCSQIADKLVDLTLTMIEHFDDWALIFFSQDGEQCDDKITVPVSMSDAVIEADKRRKEALSEWNSKENDNLECNVNNSETDEETVVNETIEENNSESSDVNEDIYEESDKEIDIIPPVEEFVEEIRLEEVEIIEKTSESEHFSEIKNQKASPFLKKIFNFLNWE